MGFALSDMQLTSDSFQPAGPIDTKYAKDGNNLSPQLSWNNVPAGTQAFAVICHDPDAPLISPGNYGFVHWVLYNIPGTTRSLDEGSNIGTSGKNNFGDNSWGGPRPPAGHGMHHYFFWILALDSETDLAAGLDMWTLLEKIEPKVIGANRLVGTYKVD